MIDPSKRQNQVLLTFYATRHSLFIHSFMLQAHNALLLGQLVSHPLDV